MHLCSANDNLDLDSRDIQYECESQGGWDVNPNAKRGKCHLPAILSDFPCPLRLQHFLVLHRHQSPPRHLRLLLDSGDETGPSRGNGRFIWWEESRGEGRGYVEDAGAFWEDRHRLEV